MCYGWAVHDKPVVTPSGLLSNGLTAIGLGAFCGCSSLASISFAEGLSTIGDEAFRGCTSLDSAATQRVRAINAAAI